jgi:hypothetical protein
MKKKKRCPHNIVIAHGGRFPAFAGAVSVCKCCQNPFGHFGNMTLCYKCDDTSPLTGTGYGVAGSTISIPYYTYDNQVH